MRWIGVITLMIGCVSVKAQSGILPFTGLRYVEKGVHCEEIDVKLEGAVWTGNRLPINTTLVIELEKPQGFTSVDGTYYPEIEVLLTRPNGDTLAYAPGMYGEGFGFSEASLSELSLDLGFNESMKTGDTCDIKARFFDLKGSNSITCDLRVILVDEKLPLETTEMTYGLTSSEGYTILGSGIELKKCSMKPSQDRMFPMLAQIEVEGNISNEEWQKGTVTVEVYDQNLNKLDVSKQGSVLLVESESAKNNIECRFSGKYYTRFRWENENKSKIVDAIFEPQAEKE